MFKRGISPLIATVLIIGFTFFIAGTIFIFQGEFVKDLQVDIEESSEEKIGCISDVGFRIEKTQRKK